MDDERPEEATTSPKKITVPWNLGKAMLLVAAVVWLFEKLTLKGMKHMAGLELRMLLFALLTLIDLLVVAGVIVVFVLSTRLQPRPAHWALIIALLWTGLRLAMFIYGWIQILT